MGEGKRKEKIGYAVKHSGEHKKGDLKKELENRNISPQTRKREKGTSPSVGPWGKKRTLIPTAEKRGRTGIMRIITRKEGNFERYT